MDGTHKGMNFIAAIFTVAYLAVGLFWMITFGLGEASGNSLSINTQMDNRLALEAHIALIIMVAVIVWTGR